MCWRASRSTSNGRIRSRQPVTREFNAFIWMPPKDTRGGHILLADSTIFTTLFGGTESLSNFWRNIATM